MVDGTLIRVPIPSSAEERRARAGQGAGKYAEQARIAVRNVRRDGMEHLKRPRRTAHLAGRGQAARDEVQKLTDRHIKRIDDALKTKEQEIMQV